VIRDAAHMNPPRLTFFCELAAEPLQAFFADPAVLEHLVALKASVSLGLLDLGAERAAVVRQLHAAGVPVIAWQLLPAEQGYWFNLDNAPQGRARYEAFRQWTVEHGLHWDGVGLDIEPDIAELRRLLAQRWRYLPALLRRLRRGEQLRQARETYAALVARIRADGYRVDTYQLPLIVDEREAGSTLLQRLLGVLPRLRDFDWREPEGAPKTTARRMELMHRAARRGLRACAGGRAEARSSGN
jgi:hypothetical protein